MLYQTLSNAIILFLRRYHVHGFLRGLAIGIGALVVGAQALAAPADGCGNRAKEGFGDRFIDVYKEHLDWNGSDPNAPEAKYRGVPPAVSNPPFPYSTWPIGGSESIGYENMLGGPLMDTLYCGPDGQALKDSRFTMYGWIEPGVNISSSHSSYNYSSGTGGNWPAAYSYQPNYVQVDQVAFYLERTPDEVQTDHIDWGFRLANLWGTDYKYTFSRDILSSQYLNNAHVYGYDPVMAYGELYVPNVADGLNIRVGRYISVPDIEAQLAPNNLTYSHSLLYSYDPYTQTGIVGTFKLNKNWTAQLEVSGGNDIAPWDSADRKFTPAVCVQWTSDSGKDSIYPCINGANDAKFAWNNLQHEVVTWYHKFNDKWNMATETWYMYEKDTPNVNNPNGAAQLAAQFPFRFGAPFGAQCGSEMVTCTSHEWAIVNYINYQIGPRDYVSWRTDFFNDNTGQRTGFKTKYSEYTLSYNHWIGDVITIRPELRFDRAYNVDAYNNPSGVAGQGSNNQWMFAVDAIFHF